MSPKTRLAEFKTYTMRELNQNTARVLDEINDSHIPAVVTKHGRFVALITPLRDSSVEQLVLSHGELHSELEKRATDQDVITYSTDDVLEQWKNHQP
ncbi:type II toxin-antitoxin system Phd/YefM family antitoxin [Actinokineospora sp. 24-640]